MEGVVSSNDNGRSDGAGIYELARAEHLSWQISKGLAVGDSRDFDLWLSSFWHDGEPSTQSQEDGLAIVVKRSAAEDKRVKWWADGDWIIGLARYLNGHYLVTSPELAGMPCIFDLDPEPLA